MLCFTTVVPKEEESAKGSENGDQDKKETAEGTVQTEIAVLLLIYT